MQYYPAYKCPLCGALLKADRNREIQYDKLPEHLAAIIKAQQFASNPFLSRDIPPMHIPHKCPDGSAGLAEFAGFKKV